MRRFARHSISLLKQLPTWRSPTSVTLLFILAIFCPRAHALEIAPTIGAADEGDDRIRPAAGLHISHNLVMGRMLYYGRTLGPLKETTMAFAVGRRYSIFKGGNLVGNIGMSVLHEETKLTFPENPDQNMTSAQWNFGAIAGVYYELMKIKPFYFNIGFESHVYLAGEAGIFLAVARKQYISIAAGMSL